MDTAFLQELHEQTVKFENWNSQTSEKTFDEAESEFFEWIDQAKSRGMTFIDRGGYRDVYAGGAVAGNDCVVKISRGSGVQNSNAVSTWQSMSEDAREFVAPIQNWGV